MVRPGQDVRLPQLAGQRQVLFRQVACILQVRLFGREQHQRIERPRPLAGDRLPGRLAQDALQPAPSLTPVIVQPPEDIQRAGKLEGGLHGAFHLLRKLLRVLKAQGPFQGCPQVVVVVLQTVQPLRLAAAAQLRA